MRALLGRNVSTHDAIDDLGERAISPEDQNLIVSFLDQFACKFDGVSGKLGDPIGERHVAFTQQFPKIDTLRTKRSFSGFGINDYSKHGNS